MGYTPNMGLKYTHTAIHSIKAKQLCATLINSIALWEQCYKISLVY